MATLKISRDFSIYPGARYRTDGPFSGEEFYESLLKEMFTKAIQDQEVLTVDLDDTAGYASSFLSESFGRLALDFDAREIKQYLNIKSIQEPDWKESILKDYIPNASSRLNHYLEHA